MHGALVQDTPTFSPSAPPFSVFSPTEQPSAAPSAARTALPAFQPTQVLSSRAPSDSATGTPSLASSGFPSLSPTLAPSSAAAYSSLQPSLSPTLAPSSSPSLRPTTAPSLAPSMPPTARPVVQQQLSLKLAITPAAFEGVKVNVVAELARLVGLPVSRIQVQYAPSHTCLRVVALLQPIACCMLPRRSGGIACNLWVSRRCQVCVLLGPHMQ